MQAVGGDVGTASSGGASFLGTRRAARAPSQRHGALGIGSRTVQQVAGLVVIWVGLVGVRWSCGGVGSTDGLDVLH